MDWGKFFLDIDNNKVSGIVFDNNNINDKICKWLK